MRTLMAILLTFIFVLGLTAGDNTKSIITVKGMQDKSCADKVTKTLKSIEGVENVLVELESGKVTIEHSDVDLITLNTAVTKAGYKTNHKISDKHHGVEAEEKSCSEVEKAGCTSPCGRKK